MANYPGLSPHHFMPCGSWQANPWDTNPPLGTTPNIVWPQSQNPYQYQGGGASWPQYNQQSLYPPYMAPQGIPDNYVTHQPPYVQPTSYQPTTSSGSLYNASNNNRSKNNMAACPCCGTMTNRQNISKVYSAKTGGSNSQSDMYAASDNTQSTTKGFPATLYQVSETQDSSSGRTSSREQNANHNALRQGKGGEDTQNPYRAHYASHVKAYQDALNAMINQNTNQHHPIRPKEVTRGDNQQRYEGGTYNQLHEAYQQSLEQMRNLQAAMQHVYQYNGQPAARGDEPKQNSITSTLTSKKETDANSFSKYFP